ncbi:hypothetical protein [Aurantimonas sp. Leaf443]|uniref:hypothetical protein n=1 Tax=Aurantimonas sp. Leaf443 TaxID=1736378 RepID=UPI0006FFDE58|nr:hypothetical protein [Aurantimonas sp. Leaf443]KQT85474.1 hypothetical protein ASG48_09630 [Aurantimonas sp. Leaf443]
MFGLSKKVRDDLWTLIVSPSVWAIHFLLSYVVAAYRCAPNVAVFESIAGARVMIAVITAVALAVIALVFLRSYREWRAEGGKPPHDEDSPADRERFLEFSTILLSGLSFISVVFVALPALLITDCR